jgi:hypothetical protein
MRTVEFGSLSSLPRPNIKIQCPGPTLPAPVLGRYLPLI